MIINIGFEGLFEASSSTALLYLIALQGAFCRNKKAHNSLLGLKIIGQENKDILKFLEKKPRILKQ